MQFSHKNNFTSGFTVFQFSIPSREKNHAICPKIIGHGPFPGSEKKALI
jgi:hypothetical protein